MIVVEVKLVSAISAARDTELGTMVIFNRGVSEDRKRGDYGVRMYRKGALKRWNGDSREMVVHEKPIRKGKVLGHRRLAEPVHNLVAKGLSALGYK